MSLLWSSFDTATGKSIIAQDDFTEVLEDVSVRILILRNDQLNGDDPIDSTSLRIIEQPGNGSTTVSHKEGTIVYTPALNFHGIDSFIYQICTVGKQCSAAIVRIKVHAVNDAPVANDDRDTLWEDQTTWIEVMTNDNDFADQIELDPSQVSIVQEAKFGRSTVAGGKILYVPMPDYFGYDMLTYSVCDHGLCDTARVELFVQPVNDKPQANHDQDSTFEGLLMVMDVLQNDFDTIDFAELDFTSISTEGLKQPEHAFTFVDTTVGLVIYIPVDNYVGFDTFEYSVCDYGPEKILCDTASVFISIVHAPSSSEFTEDVVKLVSYKNRIRSGIRTYQDIFTRNSKEEFIGMIVGQLKGESLNVGKYQYSLDSQGKFKVNPVPIENE